MQTWLVFSLLSAVFAALTTIFAKIGMKGVDSNLATFIRVLFIVPFAFALVAIQGTLKGVNKFSTTTWVFLFLSALATGLSWLFYFKALQMGEVHKVVPIDKLSFVLSIILGVVLFHESITPAGVVGIVLMVCGMLFLLQ